VLGVEVAIRLEEYAVTTAVRPAKAQAWQKAVEHALEVMKLEQGEAAKLAGRLRFAVTAAANRCGRSYIKPIHAQAARPLAGAEVSPWLAIALLWRSQYLQLRPVTVHRPLQVREELKVCTDASGEDAMVAAVLAAPEGVHFTYAKVPGWLVAQMLERGDHNIGVLEVLAVVLAVATFGALFKNRVATVYVDSVGAMYAYIKGSSRQPKSNLIVAQCLLKAAKDSFHVVF